jgi:uncharacterized protein
VIFIIAGTFFVLLGVIGIFLPLIPTTPFLLLGTALYARSSKRYYLWLLNNKWFGKYIKNYQEGKGVPIKVKILSISLMWATILISILLVLENLIFKIILLAIAFAVTIHIISIHPKKKDKKL